MVCNTCDNKTNVVIDGDCPSCAVHILRARLAAAEQDRDKWYEQGNEFKEAWRTCRDAAEAAEKERDELRATNTDLLTALQIVKEQRQVWWGKAVERNRIITELRAEVGYHNRWAKDVAAALGCADAAKYRSDAIDCIRALKADNERLAGEVERLQGAIVEVAQVLDDTQELNMSNFDIDDVAQLNNSHIEVYQIIHGALSVAQLTAAQQSAKEQFGALQELVWMKDYKDQYGETAIYLKRQLIAWDKARSAIREAAKEGK